MAQAVECQRSLAIAAKVSLAADQAARAPEANLVMTTTRSGATPLWDDANLINPTILVNFYKLHLRITKFQNRLGCYIRVGYRSPLSKIAGMPP
jgi:hypothetical protein